MTTDLIVLSAEETFDLAAQEAIVARGQRTFIEVGLALLAIRDRRLFRAAFPTFEVYCRERWGIEHSQTYRLMGAALVVDNLSPIGEVLPANEAQARPLAALPPEAQREAWTLAVEHAATGQPTAAEVAAAAAVITSGAPAGKRQDKNKLDPLHSSETPEHYTPPAIVALITDFFDGIDLDPCAEPG